MIRIFQGNRQPKSRGSRIWVSRVIVNPLDIVLPGGVFTIADHHDIVLLCCWVKKAESLLHISVGQRPTCAGANIFKAESLADSRRA